MQCALKQLDLESGFEFSDQCILELSDDWNNSDIGNQVEKIIFWLQRFFTFKHRVFARAKNYIYCAKDKKTGREVCLKFFMNCEDLPTEIRILERIRRLGGHKNVQRLLSVFAIQDSFVMCTKFEQHNPLPTTSSKIIVAMQQLVSATEFCHKNGIIHRDIKPSNLLWNDGRGFLVLCDFDISTIATQEGNKEEMGTDGFMAPEVCCKEQYFKEIDMFSIGAVLGCMINCVQEDDMSCYTVKMWRREFKKASLEKPYSYFMDLFFKLTYSDPQKRITLCECRTMLNDLFKKRTKNEKSKEPLGV